VTDSLGLDDEQIAAAALLLRRRATFRELDRWQCELGGFAAALAECDDADRAVAQARAELSRRRPHIWIRGRDGWPIRDRLSFDEPVVLLAEGSGLDALDGPRVAIVGTRAATPHGIADARATAAALASAGCTIVSGLAIGIDGAAHEGALDARGSTIGVVATGLDRTYPLRHRDLTARVRSGGLVIGESWYGTPPEAWRFPLRNRIIAALADAVVVIEATRSGGSSHTAEWALKYGRPLFAQPGSRRNPAASGCNRLIADGATPLLGPDDVLVGLGLTAAAPLAATRLPPVGHPHAEAIGRALAGEPATLDDLRDRTGLDAAEIAGALRAMERAGRVTRSRGLYWPM
jgi:DNA processing protein